VLKSEWGSGMHNPDFTYTKTIPGNVAQPALDAYQHAYRIQQTPVSEWRAQLELVPEELRVKAREILLRRYVLIKHEKALAKLASGAKPKRSQAGDQELAKMGEIVRRIMP
jgi:hypothetical protein